MPKKPDRRSASTDVRLELRRQLLMLRDQGKTHQEIAQITGYTRTYVSTMLKRLSATPQLLEGMSRGGRPQGSLRALTVKEERRAYERDDAAAQDWLTIEYPKIKARAKGENAEISWGDEAGVRSDGSASRSRR